MNTVEPSAAFDMANAERKAKGLEPYRNVVVFGNPPFSGRTPEGKRIDRMDRQMANKCAADPRVTDIFYLTPRIGIPKEFIPSLVSAKVTTDSFDMDIDQSGLSMWHWQRGYKGLCELTDAAGVPAPVDLSGFDFLPLFHQHAEAARSVFSTVPKSRLYQSWFGTVENTNNDSSFKGSAGDDNNFHCWVLGKRGERIRVRICDDEIVYLRKEFIDENLISRLKLFIPGGGSGGREGTGRVFHAGRGDVIRAGDLLIFISDDEQETERFAQYFTSTPVQYLIHILADGQNVTQKLFRLIPKPDLTQPQSNSDIYPCWGWSDELIHHAENTKLVRSIAKFDGPDKQS